MKTPDVDMKGKVCLITGANSGIGKVTATELARMDATVVMVCRDRLRGTVAMSEIMNETGADTIDLMTADVSSLSQIHQLAKQFRKKYQRLDVLINNAGVSLDKRGESADGIELTFATNYLGHFLLTHLLLDMLKQSAPSRIVNVSSFVHRWTNRIKFDDLQREGGYSSMQSYNQTKLAILMFSYELAERLEGTGVTVNALNPGLVNSNLGNNLTGTLKVMGIVMKNTIAITPEKGAQTSIYLASSPEVDGVTGKYFFKKKPKKSSKASYDRKIWEKLWQLSEELAEISKLAVKAEKKEPAEIRA
ncbi:SDR family oxidoreductase [candidate division WOR-3 bacterium]|nr:SDR family oxidoreductase [candidate division WOR-3 bacterium]